MSNYFLGKRVLFCGPKTFNYEHEIVVALERLGAVVTYRNDKLWDVAWLKGMVRLFPRLTWLISDVHYRKWLRFEAPEDVDIVFVIKGESLSPSSLTRMRKKYPNSRFVLYLWDSIANVQQVEKKFFAFDAMFSFDPDDCNNHKLLNYRPLFFLKYYRHSCVRKSLSNSFFFLGTLNGDRPWVLRNLKRALRGRVTLDYWLFVRSKLELILRKLIDRSLRSLDPDRLILIPLTPSIIADRVATAIAVVDIEHPKQAGLTMRTLEVLASERKLITTNYRIRNETFFDPTRVLIIDRRFPTIPDSFLQSEFARLPDEFFARYSIDGWLNEVLTDRKPPIVNASN